MSRIILIANRLPVTIHEKKGELKFTQSSGGLATGLKSLEGSYEKVWIGWPGMMSPDESQREVIDKELLDLNMHAIHVEPQVFNDYYYGYSNETIWPLFHYFSQYVKNDENYWNAYKKVNQIFAEKVISIAKPDDIIWVHDYHLMLLPKLLRDHFKISKIGFFLHIPFPSYELFRTLPHREELLDGILGSDLIGFHTYDYIRHFNSSISRILGYGQHHLGRFNLANRVVDIESFPMGINFEKYSQAVEEEKVQIEIKKLKKVFGKEKTILSIDRLDYSKGVPQRLEAFETFLERYEEYRGKVSLQMVLVPSRSEVDSYKHLKEDIDRIVGRINGRFGTLNWTPIHYYYRSIPFETLIALYHLSPIALITPFRDGMNLVSKEFIATKPNGNGVLILSEMAGASKELVSALSVNPNNIESIVNALHKALNMKEDEMQKRMFEMQKVVKRSNVNKWGQKFIEALLDVSRITNDMYKTVIDGKTEEKLISDYKKADLRLLFLDYDGTLVGFNNDPALAVPPEETLKNLDLLSRDPKNKIIVISGRKKDTLEEWLGHLKLDLVAEHGSWIKLHRQNWKSVNTQDLGWKKELTEILEQFSIKTAGSFIEEKSYSLVWHYRNVDPMLADIRKNELLETLNKFISDKQLNIQEGNKVIEVKPHNINKGAAAQKWIDTIAADFIMAIGDDITDEDTFKVMPDEAFTIKVGLGETIAKYKIEGIKGVANLIGKMTKISQS